MKAVSLSVRHQCQPFSALNIYFIPDENWENMLFFSLTATQMQMYMQLCVIFSALYPGCLIKWKEEHRLF